jgi:hypothetical protein
MESVETRVDFRLAIDFDDVLVPFTEHFLRFCEDLGIEVNKEATDMWWEGMMFPKSTYEEARGYFDSFTSSEAWKDLHDVAPSRACRVALESVKKACHCELLVLSSRSKDFQIITETWIERFFPGVFSRVILCGYYDTKDADGSIVASKLTKAKVCELEQISFLVDDNYAHLLELADPSFSPLVLPKRATLDKTSEAVKPGLTIIRLGGTTGILFGSNSWTLHHKLDGAEKGMISCRDWRDFTPDFLRSHWINCCDELIRVPLHPFVRIEEPQVNEEQTQ